MNALPSPPERSSERAQAQCERILCAAEKCFIKHGFHAAGMALIAETAEMSPGLIYRYFENKHAIILAIVERQLQNARASIQALHDATDMSVAAFNTFNDWRTGDPRQMNAALFLEMSAEASRNPELAAAIAASDQAVRAELGKWLTAPISKGGKGLPPEIAHLRAMSLQCFMEGLALRALREPNIAQTDIKVVIQHFMDGLYATAD